MIYIYAIFRYCNPLNSNQNFLIVLNFSFIEIDFTQLYNFIQTFGNVKENNAKELVAHFLGHPAENPKYNLFECKSETGVWDVERKRFAQPRIGSSMPCEYALTRCDLASRTAGM